MSRYRTNIDIDSIVEVHEHRAATDESVKLLKEFEEKARKNYLGRLSLGENTFKAECHFFKDLQLRQLVIYVQFKLNGLVCEEKIEFPYLEYLTTEEIISRIENTIAKRISKEIFVNTWESLSHSQQEHLYKLLGRE